MSEVYTDFDLQGLSHQILFLQNKTPDFLDIFLELIERDQLSKTDIRQAFQYNKGPIFGIIDLLRDKSITIQKLGAPLELALGEYRVMIVDNYMLIKKLKIKSLPDFPDLPYP